MALIQGSSSLHDQGKAGSDSAQSPPRRYRDRIIEKNLATGRDIEKRLVRSINLVKPGLLPINAINGGRVGLRDQGAHMGAPLQYRLINHLHNLQLPRAARGLEGDHIPRPGLEEGAR